MGLKPTTRALLAMKESRATASRSRTRLADHLRLVRKLHAPKKNAKGKITNPRSAHQAAVKAKLSHTRSAIAKHSAAPTVRPEMKKSTRALIKVSRRLKYSSVQDSRGAKARHAQNRTDIARDVKSLRKHVGRKSAKAYHARASAGWSKMMRERVAARINHAPMKSDL